MAGGTLSGVEKTTLYLPAELHRALRAEARRTGVTQAELVREALRERLAAQPAPDLSGFIGMTAAEDVPAADDERRLERYRGMP